MKCNMKILFELSIRRDGELWVWTNTQMNEQCSRSSAASHPLSKALHSSLGYSSTIYRKKTFKKEVFHAVDWIDSNEYLQRTDYWSSIHMFGFRNQRWSLHIVKYNGCLYQLLLSVHLHATENLQTLIQPAVPGWKNSNVMSEPSQSSINHTQQNM